MYYVQKAIYSYSWRQCELSVFQQLFPNLQFGHGLFNVQLSCPIFFKLTHQVSLDERKQIIIK